MMLERYPEKMVDGTPPKSLFREIWGVLQLQLVTVTVSLVKKSRQSQKSC
jgi:hypothetical protein